MKRNTQKHKGEILGSGRYLRLVREEGWEYVERLHCKGVVIILALTKDRRLIFTEQFRLPVAKNVIEYPAGLIADGRHNSKESYRQAAQRELLEETGYLARRISKIVSGPSSSGSSSVILTFVRATQIKKIQEGGGNSSEQIHVHEIPLKQVERWLKVKERKGCLVDPKIYAGLYFLNKYNTCNL